MYLHPDFLGCRASLKPEGTREGDPAKSVSSIFFLAIAVFQPQPIDVFYFYFLMKL